MFSTTSKILHRSSSSSYTVAVISLIRSLSYQNRMSKYDFDYLVIGGGSGGVRSSRIAAGHGAKVALVELSEHHGPPTYSAIGGTCVNVGCVPKKIFVYGSRFSDMVKDAQGFGWDANQNGFKWESLLEKKNNEITRLNGAYGKILKNAGSNGGVQTLLGKATFLDPHTVEISPVPGVEGSKSMTVSAEVITVAVGGWPKKPKEVIGIEHAITSNEFFYLPHQPKRVLMVGGGYIAAEFACVFNGYGSKVTLMYRGAMFLRGFDNTVREHLATQMKEAGIELLFNTNPSKIEKKADGSFVVTTEDGTVSIYDCVVYATGRIPKTDGLGLDKAGVALGKDGEILVNQHHQTNVPHIFAVGDVTDRIQLTPVALREGHFLADNLFQNSTSAHGMLRGGSARLAEMKSWKTVDYEYIASAVFTTPEIGTVGYGEEEAAKKFKNITVYLNNFKPMLHTITGRNIKSVMKLIVDDATDRVVGAHMVGDSAGETIQGIAIALKCGATKAHFDATVGIHPTAAEEFCTMRTPSYRYKDGAKL